MAPNPRRQDARLQELYDRVPAIECKGYCHNACCFIDASRRERDRLERAAGRRLTTIDAAAPGGPGTKVDHSGRLLARYRCSMLTDDGRCSVYALRPMICRLFGVVDVDALTCEYGCRSERRLTAAEGVELLGDAMAVDGSGPSGATMRAFMESSAAAHDAVVNMMNRGLDGT